MTILIALAAFWGFLFLLSLALVTANRRVQLVDEPVGIEFQVSPHLLANNPEELEPIREVVSAKLAEPAGRRAKRVAGEKQVIFVVDDDPDILNLIKHVLDNEGYDVHSFTNPEEALEEFNTTSRRPEMVLTDYCMQPMNGLELIHRCRESAPELKTIVISGMVDERAISSMPEKTNAFISKPFKVTSLVETLETTLAESLN
jgi:CheY-like chemotaxis protein